MGHRAYFFVEVDLAIDEVARQLADALTMELTLRDGQNPGASRPSRLLEGRWLGGFLDENYLIFYDDPQNVPPSDYYRYLFCMSSNLYDNELQRDEAAIAFTELCDRVPWPMMFTDDLDWVMAIRKSGEVVRFDHGAVDLDVGTQHIWGPYVPERTWDRVLGPGLVRHLGDVPDRQPPDAMMRSGPDDPGVHTVIASPDAPSATTDRSFAVGALAMTAAWRLEPYGGGDLAIGGRAAGLEEVAARAGVDRARRLAMRYRRPLPNRARIILADDTLLELTTEET